MNPKNALLVKDLIIETEILKQEIGFLKSAQGDKLICTEGDPFLGRSYAQIRYTDHESLLKNRQTRIEQIEKQLETL